MNKTSNVNVCWYFQAVCPAAPQNDVFYVEFNKNQKKRQKDLTGRYDMCVSICLLSSMSKTGKALNYVHVVDTFIGKDRVVVEYSFLSRFKLFQMKTADSFR